MEIHLCVCPCAFQETGDDSNKRNRKVDKENQAFTKKSQLPASRSYRVDFSDSLEFQLVPRRIQTLANYHFFKQMFSVGKKTQNQKLVTH